MLIDLHNHTGWGSGDSHLDPSDLIQRARRWGLDGVAITEHNQLWDPEKVLALRERHGFLVLGGAEVDTDVGHVLVFGLRGPRRWNRLPTIDELRSLVDESGGVIVGAHPFRGLVAAPPGDGWAAMVERQRWRAMDAIEVYNGLAGPHQRALAAELARHLGLPTTGGSDTHRPMDVGTSFTIFEDPLANEDDLVAAIKAGRCRGADWSSEGMVSRRVQELTAAPQVRGGPPSQE